MEKLLIAIWFSVSLAIALFLFFLSPVFSGPDYRPVEIAKGSGFQGIIQILADKRIIRSPKVFMFYGLFSGSAHQLKPGSYVLSAGSSTPEIISELVRGPILDQEITFPEGLTLKDIDVLLSRAKILPAGALINFNQSYEVGLRKIGKYEFLRGISSLEGFLFPDTYRFFINSNVDAVISKFLDNFGKKAQPLFSSNKLPITNYQLLIIASLLEKEAPDFQDRQLIAGILFKRLAAGIGLQIDATVTYAKCGGAFLTCGDPKVYRKDLSFQSPYNTYLYRDLPPGPIGNPGLDAIKAALTPIQSDYLYYLSDPKTKQTIFSKTLEEHIENRAKYLGV